MPAYLERIRLNRDESFFIGVFQDNLDKNTWHYHNNYEISFITEGSGRRIVADSMEDFHPGDLVIIGPNLPHVWIADKGSIGLTSRTLEMVFLQFTAHVLPVQVLDLPEFKYIRRAMELSERGIQSNGHTLNQVSEIMLQLPYLGNFERMIHFFRLMDIIGRSESNLTLASEEYLRKRFKPANKRIETIHNHFMHNYREELNLSKLADLVNMAEGSLCRFFKMNTGMTVFEYLNRLKVDFACKLLMDPDLNILEVCLDSGFNNLSHFNKQFRKVTGITPTAYRQRSINLPYS
jgi:AraC-like DNA-binding protein